MFTQDPFQTSLGAYAGATTPFGTLHNQFQNPGINPLAAIMAMQHQGYPGIQNYGAIHPLQQQGAGLQNPLVAASLQNPLLAAVLQHQIQNQIVAALQQQQNPFGLQPSGQGSIYGQSPYGQNPYGQNAPWGQFGQTSLAPQSWVGQGGQLGGAQAIGQIHPLLAQLAARSVYGPSVPWGTY